MNQKRIKKHCLAWLQQRTQEISVFEALGANKKNFKGSPLHLWIKENLKKDRPKETKEIRNGWNQTTLATTLSERL